MATITQVSRAMQKVLGPIADQLGWATGFNQRSNGKLSGGVFVQSLVFGSLNEAELSYTQLSQAALDAGVVISNQGLAQRFSAASASLVRQVLEVAIGQVIASDPIAVPLLQRFAGVVIRDSSVINLPEELQDLFPGVGGRQGATAAVKLQVRLDYRSGQLGGPVLRAGREHDRHSPFQEEPLPAGTIRMADLGFFSLHHFLRDQRQGVYWFSRMKVGTSLYDEQGQALDLLPWLRQHGATRFEAQVFLGKQMRLPCRLLVEHVPEAVTEQRQQRLLDHYGRKKQVQPAATTLALAEWTLILTNIPPEQLSLAEALVLLTVRWQIELLFRLWKSLFLIDEWRSHNPWRILTELYAKLLAVVILHWTFLIDLWSLPQRSLWKAALTVRHFATVLALALRDPVRLSEVLARIQQHFRLRCSLNPRAAHPNTYQRLLQPPDV